jgi:L-ascorbate metabolism protein UlaG (beta-lactamase superfamily)
MLTTLLAAVSLVAADSVRIEYIAHAAFVIESPTGVRVAVDPYNSQLWMGYEFPRGVAASIALVTHPHYDHDATYELAGAPSVLREPGSWSIGDVRIRGIQTAHRGAANLRARGQDPAHVVWLIETGGVRIVHTGDSEPLTAAQRTSLGRVDVLITGETARELATSPWRSQPARTVIPMHYHHDSLSLETDLAPVDSMVADARAVRRVDGSTLFLHAGRTSNALGMMVVLKPAASVRRWSADFARGVHDAVAARRQLADTAVPRATVVAAFQDIVHRSPTDVRAHLSLARALVAAGDSASARLTLEHILARSPMGDIATTADARLLLGRLYLAADMRVLAAPQFQAVIDAPHGNITLRDAARRELAQP